VSASNRAHGLTGFLCTSLLFGFAHSLSAQGIATALIRGTVRDSTGRPVDGATARVLNTATGVSVSTRVVRGRLLVQGLEIGGPYVVEVRRIGFVPLRTEPMRLALGDALELHLTMRPLAAALDTVVVAGFAPRVRSGSLISDSLVHRLPTPNRNFFDFVALAPQISTKVGFGRAGVSAAGANMRFNSFLINGVEERAVNGSVSAAQNTGKSIPLDAVKEFTVLVAPYDVRYGDFAGALVNTVTRSGTNTLTGSVFTHWRSDRFMRADTADSETYDRMQYGLFVAGPILRDAVHFLVAAEAQRTTSVAPGPYVGQPADRTPVVPVSDADLRRFEDIMSRYELVPGSGRLVENGRPLRNVFARIDAALPRWNSRAFGFVSDFKRRDDSFSRIAPDTFSLSSHSVASQIDGRVVSFQLHTDVRRPSSGHNELMVSQLTEASIPDPASHQPLVRVRVAGTGGLPVMINSGTAEGAQGRHLRSRSIRIRDEFNMPLGNDHALTLGVQAEHFRIRRSGVNGGYGTWTFASLDDLESGAAERFELRRDFGTASSPFSGSHFTAFAGDEWRVNDRVSVTMGIRADRVTLNERAPRSAEIDSIFGRRTDDVPRSRVHLSPRIGFTSSLSEPGKDQLRGGVGLFTGRPPLAWFVSARSNYGEAIGSLSCGSLASDRGAPPAFVPDHRTPPTQCATGPAVEARPLGEVNLLDRNLRMAQALRASLAYERSLPWSVLATTELLGTRYVSDFKWVNLNLEGPQGTDRFGRVLYGTTNASGVPQPERRSDYAEVIDLRNTSKNYSFQLSARMDKQFDDRLAATLGYTFSRTRDVQSPSRVNLTGLTMWADARALSGRHETDEPGISLNDIPHRIVAALTYEAPWKRWSTALSFYYVGESGSPFTYVATGAARRGDLNADGSNSNDPLYIPRSVLDTSEIRFVDQSEAIAFSRFISRTPCLRNQRGRILERNSCREPWSHTTVASLRQAIPIRGAQIEIEADAYNVLNLLNPEWGKVRISAPRLLEQVSRTSGSMETSQPVFRFDSSRDEWTTVAGASAFQLQIAARYRF
jgi:hypothetical protein